MAPAQDRGAPRPTSLLCAILFLFFPASTYVEAQTALASASVAVPASVAGGADEAIDRVDLLVGRSAVIDVGTPIARVSLTRPEVADAVPTSPQQLLVHGKSPGAITMFVWDRAGGIKRYDVSVRRDLVELVTQMQQLFPGEPIKVSGNGKDVVVSGAVSSKYVAEKAVDIAAGFVEKKDNVVNLLQLREGARSNQVLLRVRFAEVSRSALTELGASFFTSATGYKDYVARATTQQYAAPTFDTKDGNPSLIFSDFLNLFLFNNKEGLGTLIRAMQNRGLFQSLAEPNLIAENGKEASFLAGGEYPYPAVQGNAATLAVTIMFKEFGIRLNFTPTILEGDQIRLKVRPEVSTLDFTNAVSYQGFRIPALSTRRAETEVELQNGQTFAIAGLLNNTMTSSLQKIPGIGDIPVLGMLFRSKAAQKSQTELVVMITPQILPRGSNGVNDRLPGLIEPYLPPAPRTVPPPPPYPGQLPGEPQPSAATPAPAPGFPAAASATPGMAAAVPPPQPQVQPAPVVPDPEALEREEKEVRKRLEAEAKEARAEAKRQQEAEAEQAKQAAEEAKRQQKLEAEALKRAAEEARRQQQAEAEEAVRRQKAEAEAAKRAAEEAKRQEKLQAEEAKRAEEKRKREEKLERERARRDEEAARKQAEADRKRAEELREVENRLKAAQAAYRVAVQKSKQK